MKTYLIQHKDLDWMLKLEIEENSETTSKIIEMVQFWGNWKIRLASNNNNYLNTFCKQVGRKALDIMLSEGFNLFGVCSWFEDAEGWYKIDGTEGIKIAEMDYFEIEEEDFTVKEVS